MELEEVLIHLSHDKIYAEDCRECESEGEFSDTNFSSNVDDLITMFDYMKENNTTPQIIIIHSLGDPG